MSSTEDPPLNKAEFEALETIKRSEQRDRRKVTAMAVGGGLVAVLVGAVIGYLVGHAGDKSAQVASLSDQVGALSIENSGLSNQLSIATATSSTPTDTSTGDSTSTTAATPAPPIGQSQTIGSLSVRPTSFDKISGGGSSVTWRVAITVKNNGSTSADPFCGGGHGSLTDAQGNVYDANEVINEGGSVNCGDAVQPGLSLGPYLEDYKTPPGAKPATLTLWALTETQDEQQSWSVSK